MLFDKIVKTKFKLTKLAFILFLISGIISCSQKSETKILPPPPQLNVVSMTTEFSDAWNKKDSAVIMSFIAENAMLMKDSIIHRGNAAIAENWVGSGVKVVSNLKSSSVISDNDNKIAYDCGTYIHDLTLPEGPMLKLSGNYSFIWTKQSNEEWKISFIHIENLSAIPQVN